MQSNAPYQKHTYYIRMESPFERKQAIAFEKKVFRVV